MTIHEQAGSHTTGIAPGDIVCTAHAFGQAYEQVIGLCDRIEREVVTIRMTHVKRHQAADCHRPADKAFTHRFPALFTEARLEEVCAISAEERNVLIEASHVVATRNAAH
ncbi:hypothetical protein R5M92_04210 [Halomonas sp. Bachu 37]|uniref:hypothetical protein n=1 Tax=Halomonas kashgarensis TaxID=3084920 RepID=UPI0032165FF9